MASFSSPSLALPSGGWAHSGKRRCAEADCFACAFQGLDARPAKHSYHALAARAIFEPNHIHSGFPNLMMGGLTAVLLSCVSSFVGCSTGVLARPVYLTLDFLRGVPCGSPEGKRVASVHAVALAQTERDRSSASASHLTVRAELQDDQTTVAYARATVLMVLQGRPAAPMPPSVPSSFESLIASPFSPSSDRWLPVANLLSRHIPHFNCFGCGATNECGFRCAYEVNARTGALRSFLRAPHGSLPEALALVPVDCIAVWCAMVHYQHLALTSNMEVLFVEAIGPQSAATNPAAASNIMAYDQVVAYFGRQVVVVVNLYDLSAAKPRLCLTARLTFTLADDAIVQRLLGAEYLASARTAMAAFARARDAINVDNAQRGEPPMQRIELTKSARSKAKM